MKNLNCDSDFCLRENSPIKILPADDENPELHLCYFCYLKELKLRLAKHQGALAPLTRNQPLSWKELERLEF